MTDLEKYGQHLPECDEKLLAKLFTSARMAKHLLDGDVYLSILSEINKHRNKCTCGLSAAIKKGEGE